MNFERRLQEGRDDYKRGVSPESLVAATPPEHAMVKLAGYLGAMAADLGKVKDAVVARITYTAPQRIGTQFINDNIEDVRKFLGGKFPECPACHDTLDIEDEYGGHVCNACASRCLPVQIGTKPDGKPDITWIDWDDTILRHADGRLTIERGENFPGVKR